MNPLDKFIDVAYPFIWPALLIATVTGALALVHKMGEHDRAAKSRGAYATVPVTTMGPNGAVYTTLMPIYIPEETCAPQKGEPR